MPWRIREVQPTPNPNALKLVLDAPVSQQPISFFDASAASDHPLAARLFAIEGVSSLLLLGDFITINKRPESNWKTITRSVEAVLAASDAQVKR
jgi:hypothetical protein